MYEQYLNREHEYGKFDCILLPKEFYKKELNKDYTVPNYNKSKKWMLIPKETIIENLEKCAVLISLTDAKKYDLLVFSSKNHIIHFGIFLAPVKMLHVEEGQRAKIENISSYWWDHLYAIYRLA